MHAQLGAEGGGEAREARVALPGGYNMGPHESAGLDLNGRGAPYTRALVSISTRALVHHVSALSEMLVLWILVTETTTQPIPQRVRMLS